MNRHELLEFLDRLGIDPKAYHLDGRLEHDTYGVRDRQGKWEVFYFERGTADVIGVYETHFEAYDKLASILAKEDAVNRKYWNKDKQ